MVGVKAPRCLASRNSPRFSRDFGIPSVIPYANHDTTIITQHINTQNGFGCIHIYWYIYIYICIYYTIYNYMDLVILISLFVSWMRLMSISILTSSYMFISMCHKNTPSYNSSNTTGPQKRRRPGHGLQCELQALQAALRISGRWLLCEFRRWRRSPHGRCGWRGGTTSRAWPGVFRRVFMRNCLIRNSGWKKNGLLMLMFFHPWF